MFCDISLARRIEAVEAGLVSAIVDHVSVHAPDLGAWREDVAGGTALFAGVGNPVNKVIGIGFDVPPSPAELERIERRYHATGAPVRVEMSTLARAESHTALSSRGYLAQGFENVLGQLIGAGVAIDDPASDIEIRRVESGQVDAWLRALVDGFATPDQSGAGGTEALPSSDELLGVFRQVFLVEGYRRYLALIDGVIAGGAIAWFDDGIAYLGGASTLPALRRRGVQRALFESRLRDARAAACTLAVLGTQPGTTSQANAQRRGFSLLYSRAIWTCPPPDQVQTSA